MCTSADMAVYYHVILGTDFPQLVPVSVVDAGETVEGWVVREADCFAALGDHALDLIDHQFAVPDRQQSQRNDAAWVSTGPLINMPVIIGLDHALGALSILCLMEQVTGKGGKGGETH